jgi:hypothetical protein
MPDFALAMKKAGLTSKSLGRMRVRPYGETERWSPGAALISWSNMDRLLPAFPAADAPVVELEAVPAAVEPILRALLALEERPVWLLRQGEDNAFRQVIGGRVRPSQAYVIVTRKAPSADLAQSLSLRQSATDLAGVGVYSFCTPTLISQSTGWRCKDWGWGFLFAR